MRRKPKAVTSLLTLIGEKLSSHEIAFNSEQTGGGQYTWLDIRVDNVITIVVHYKKEIGYGISHITEGTGYGEGPDNVFTDMEEAANHVVKIVLENQDDTVNEK